MIKINKAYTATFDVDAEKCFTPLCPNELPVPGGDEIVDELNAQAEFAAFRIGSKDAHPEIALWNATRLNPQFTPLNYENVDMKWNQHGVAGTRGADLLEGLPHPTEYGFFVWKGMEPDMHPYGACYHDLQETLETGIFDYLNIRCIDTIIIGGLALDYCVATTAKQLSVAGFDVIINLAATRSIAEDTKKKVMDELKNKYDVIFIDSSAELELEY